MAALLRGPILKELAGLGLVHAGAAAVLCRNGGTTPSSRQQRILIAASIAIFTIAHRWKGPSRQIIASILLTKLLPIFEGNRRNLPFLAVVFMPTAAEMWCRWCDACAGVGRGLSVHGNFTGTMAALTGVGKDVRKFAAAPDTFLHPKPLVNFWVTAPRSILWSGKALGTVYSIQQLVGWLSSRKKRKDAEKQPPTVQQRLLTVFINTLRTTVVYTILSQYSVWAFMRMGHRKGGIDAISLAGAPLFRGWHWSLPSSVFLLEPLNRAITLCEYYIAHLIYTLLSDLGNWAGGSVASFITSPAAPAAVLAAYAASGRRPPSLFYAPMRMIADRVAPPPRETPDPHQTL